jgi:hypothetical protein
MPKYFAYGSNCDPEVLDKKGVRFSSRQRATLPGYRLLFNKRSLRPSLPDAIGFANICPCDNSVVEGLLYDIGPGDLERLDASERHPKHYDRIRVVVQADSGEEEAWVYRAQPEMTADGLVPSRNYLNHILAGREFLSQQYFEALDQSLTYRADCIACRRTGEVLFVREGDQLHTLCQSCREARIRWGDTLDRPLTVAETATIMAQLVIDGPGFPSLEALIKEAVARNLIRPA